jgi:hypothetical protein
MEIRFCDRCHESIPDADFDAGRAVTLGTKNLHVACALQRASAVGGPRSWLTFALALLAAVAATYLLARDGWQGPNRGVSTAVQRKIDEAADGAVARSSETVAATARSAQEMDAKLVAEVAAVRGELRVLKDGLEQRIDRAEGAVAEQVAPVAERLQALADKVNEIEGWMRSIAQRAEERAAAPSPEPAGPPPPEPVKPEPTPAPAPAPAPTPTAAPADPNHDALVDMWIQRLKDSNEGIAFSATIELGRLKDLRATPPLIEVLGKHKDFYARLGAATALGELTAVDSIPALIDALNDKDDLVRTAADEALRAIAEPILTEKDREELQFQANMNTTDRRRVQNRWRAWWKANESALRTQRAQPAGGS